MSSSQELPAMATDSNDSKPSVKRRLDQPSENAGNRTPAHSTVDAFQFSDDERDELVYTPPKGGTSGSRARVWKVWRSARRHLVKLLAILGVAATLYYYLVVTTSGPAKGFLARRATNVYKVIFDAGSTGSRVQLFKFGGENNSILEPVSPGVLTLFRKVDGGLSSYAKNPEECKRGLEWLVSEAIAAVPESRGAQVVVSATAGLRMLPREEADALLEATRSVMRASPFELRRDADVYIMDGADEARYQWMSVDFAYRAAGLPSAVIDLGGGSVQLAYGIEDGELTPSLRSEYAEYLSPLASSRSLYVNSWLGFGLKAARRKVLEMHEDGSHPCILASETLPATYEYSGATLALVADDSDDATRGARCLSSVSRAMKASSGCGSDADRCAFDGRWRGPVDGSRYTFRLYSYIFDLAKAHGLVGEGEFQATVSVGDFRAKAHAACRSEVGGTWGCMDMSFITALLSEGFGVGDEQSVIVANKLEYGDFLVEAAWPLGAAVDRLE